MFTDEIKLDCWQSVFLSKYFSRDYEERLFSLKENGTRHARTKRKSRLAFFPTRPFHPVSISLHGQRHLRSRWLNAGPSDP